PTSSARPPAFRTALANATTFSGIWDIQSNVQCPMSKVKISQKDFGLWTLDLVFVRGFNEDLNAARRRNAANDLRAIDFSEVAAGCMPQFHPEGPRIAVNGERRTIVHHCHWLREHTVAQFFKQLGD